jgi:2-amino-4-hydroxy-6-hydroxymethyldihydropteridine diphosphokinase
MAAQRIHQAFVGLGSNLQDPVQQVRAALAALATLPGTQLARRSSLYRSKPVGYADQPDFVNAVAELRTELQPEPLLQALLQLEQRHGRVRSVRNGPRTLDLDLLLYDAAELNEPELTLPHPRMHERAFVLLPLAEIAPQASVPGRGRVADLLRAVDTREIALLEQA